MEEKRRRPFLTCGMVALLLAVATLAALWMWKNSQADRLIEAARARGEPTTLAELDAWYPEPPAGENAAPVYARAFAQAGVDGLEIDPLPFVGRADDPPLAAPLAPDILAAAEAQLDKKKAYLASLHEAALYPACRFPIDLKLGPMADLSHLKPLRVAAHWLELEAAVASERQHPEQAVEAVRAAFALGEALRQEPILISQFARSGVRGVALDTLERVLSRMALPEDTLKALAEELALCEDLEAQHRGLAGERCALTDAAAGYYRTLPVVGSWDRQACLRISEHLLLNALAAPETRLAGDAKIKQAADALPFFCFISRTVLPALAGTSASFVRDLAQVRAATVAVAVERCRLAHGALPAKIEDLVPEFLKSLPPDPFAGAPLLYRTLEPGYVIYSVGQNGVDDAGREKATKDEQKNKIHFPDVAFQVAR